MVRLGLGGTVADVADVELFDLGSGPGGFAQEDQARFYAGIVGEAADRDQAAELLPAVVLHQGGDDVLKRFAVQRVAGGLVHGGGVKVASGGRMGPRNTRKGTKRSISRRPCTAV